jgi:eukaryotic-like serine/threonine-protein kinase
MAVMPVRLVAGRYALERSIGRGGMGTVWLAHDRLLGREVAVKEVTFPETLPHDEIDSLRARVLREARAAARLNHPGVITLYDVLSEQGRAYIVMELVLAPSLAELVARQGPLRPQVVAGIGLQVASALEAAHRAGVVHRDVKPANVLVGEDGGVWLGDFGIAHVEGDPRLTVSGIIVGSPWYMAPEQASGGEIGPATDLWGLGATMYYAVEGQAPFERPSTLAALGAVVNEPPREPQGAGALAPILMSLLEKDPAARPSLRQVRIRLARVAASRAATGNDPAARVAQPDLFTPASPRKPATNADTPGGDEQPKPATQRFGWPWRDEGTARRRWPMAVAAFVAVALLAGVAAMTLPGRLRGGGADNEPSAAPTNATGPPVTGPPATSSSASRTGTSSGTVPTTSPPQRPPTSKSGAAIAATTPAGWARFTNRSGGYAVVVPSGWRRSTGLARHGTSFRDGVGRSIKVESAHPPQTPPNGDPLPGWIDNERYWSSRLPGYRRIGSVHKGTYHGMRAAIWEYTYAPTGRPTHGLNISFVSPSRSWGYSVLSLIPEDHWRSSQELIRSFEQGFSPLA